MTATERFGEIMSQAVNKFMLGTKELDEKVAEFHYDRGWYSIVDVLGEEKNVVYKSRNAQEAYTKWNVYIGRKKERPERPERSQQDRDNNGSQPEESRQRNSDRRRR